MGKLDGKVAIVTGSSRGIGRDIALAFGQEGAKVVVTARTEKEGDSRLVGSIGTTVQRIRDAGGAAIGIPCNVSEDESVEQLVSKTVAEFGRVDILINNAAIRVPGTILQMQPRHWDLLMRVNLRAPFMLCRAVIPHMIQQGWGHIINISSLGAIGPGVGPYTSVGGGDATSYGTTKKAIERFSQGLAHQVWDKNVAVNVLLPRLSVASEGMLFFLGKKVEDMKGLRPNAQMVADAAIAICAKEPKTFTGHIKTEEEYLQAEGVDISTYKVI